MDELKLDLTPDVLRKSAGKERNKDNADKNITIPFPEAFPDVAKAENSPESE